MKYLIPFLLILAGCTQTPTDAVGPIIRESNQNVWNMKKSCIKLGQCMDGKYSIIHFNHQPHAPYACEISLKNGNQTYFYPDADLSFGDLGLGSVFKNAITACEMLKQKGDYSPEARERFRKWSAEQEAKKKQKPTTIPEPEIAVKEY